jgi:hypothetical protein
MVDRFGNTEGFVMAQTMRACERHGDDVPIGAAIWARALTVRPRSIHHHKCVRS